METSMVFTYPDSPIWDWRVAFDLFFGGMGVGAFLFALLLDWRYEGKFKRICQTGAVLAPIFVMIGLVFLMTKMGRPMAMYLTFTAFAPSSPLWWGGIFQTLFVLGTLYYARQWLNPEQNPDGRRRWGWALLPVGLVVGAYHGFLLGIFQTRPLWSTGPTVVAAVLGFVTTGIAAILLIHLIRMKFAGRLTNTAWVNEFLSEIRQVRTILGLALMFQVFTFFIWWVSLSYGGLDARSALAAANAAYGPLFWFVGIGLGLMLPLLLGGYTVLQGNRAGLGLELNMIWITSVLILIGGFVFRLAVVLGGQITQPIGTLS